jgi:hypothetical protein
VFFPAITWSIALAVLALWAGVRWLTDPTPQNARSAGLAAGIAIVVLASTWWWLSR